MKAICLTTKLYDEDAASGVDGDDDDDQVFCFQHSEGEEQACFNTEEDCEDTEQFLERFGVEPSEDCEDFDDLLIDGAECSVIRLEGTDIPAGFQCGLPPPP